MVTKPLLLTSAAGAVIYIVCLYFLYRLRLSFYLETPETQEPRVDRDEDRRRRSAAESARRRLFWGLVGRLTLVSAILVVPVCLSGTFIGKIAPAHRVFGSSIQTSGRGAFLAKAYCLCLLAAILLGLYALHRSWRQMGKTCSDAGTAAEDLRRANRKVLRASVIAGICLFVLAIAILAELLRV